MKKTFTKWQKDALKYLVDHVSQFQGGEKTVTYGELAKGIGFPEPHSGSYFGKRIGHALGIMGHLFDGLQVSDWSRRIPYIQALVVKSNDGLPGDGLKEFVPDYESLSIAKQKDYLRNEYIKIFTFGERWYLVLEQLGITPSSNLRPLNAHTGNLFNPFGSEGSPEHIQLREYVLANPELFHIQNLTSKHAEYQLVSGDKIDAVFQEDNMITGVEVKSRRSGEDDLCRGVYQTIKYAALLAAEEKARKTGRRHRAILATETPLPTEAAALAKHFNINHMIVDTTK